MNSPYVNPDGSFVGGFDGCVLHFTREKGLSDVAARKMCAYIGRETGHMARAPGAPRRLVTAKEFSIALQTGATPPGEIQYMPPGERTITTVNPETGEPETSKVIVDAQAAQRLDAILQQRRNLAAAGQEDYPFFDFNHDDGEASGRPIKLFWAGDDPRTGGIRAQVEWSDSGVRALSGKVPSYRRFSPSFYTNASGEIVDAPINMGGLVNRAAFKTITPIAAGGPGANPKPNHMDPNEKLVAELAAAQKQINELQAKLSENESAKVIQAKDAEIKSLQSEIKTLKEAQVEQIKLDAKAAVADAINAGKIPPKDTETAAHYESLYIANPAATKAILAKMPENPAFKTIVHASAGTGATLSGTPAEQFVQLVNAKSGELKSQSKALDLVIREKPELYKAWREANGRPGLAAHN